MPNFGLDQRKPRKKNKIKLKKTNCEDIKPNSNIIINFLFSVYLKYFLLKYSVSKVIF
jgi:hypothetical protein